MEKISKHDLKAPDAFISNMQRFGEWAYDKRGAILTLIGILVAAAIVWAGIGTYQSQKEDKAQEALFNATKKMTAQDDLFNPPDEQTMPGQAKKEKNSPSVKAVPATKSGDLATDYKEAVPAFNEVINQYGNTQAAVIAELDLGRLDHDYKKYDDEITVLNKALATSDHPVTKAMALTNLGSAYEAKGDCSTAITQWQKIQNDSTMAPFIADSLLKTGLCYEKLNQNDKAIATYQRFDDAEKEIKTLTNSIAQEYQINVNAGPEGQSARSVEKFKHALAQSAKYQELEGILSDREAVRSAKKYLKLLKRG